MKIKNILRRSLIGVFWIIVWGLIARLVGLPKLLPGPLETAQALFRLCGTAAFYRSVGMTLVRVALGYCLAVACGVLLAAGCHWVKGLDAVLSPLRTVIRATPVSSFILLVWLWLQRSHVPVFISFLMVLPIIWTATQEALGSVDRDLKEMAAMYRFSRWKKIRYLYAPSAAPAFQAACMTGLGFAWKSGIAAEVIALTPDSVGKHLSDAKNYLEYPDLFAWTLTVILLSMALESGLKALARRRKGATQRFVGEPALWMPKSGSPHTPLGASNQEIDPSRSSFSKDFRKKKPWMEGYSTHDFVLNSKKGEGKK